MKGKKYILFGCGVQGEFALNYLGRSSVAFFVDNTPPLNFHGFKVLNYDELKNVHSSYVVVIAVRKIEYQIEIANQLNADDIPFITFEQAAKHLIDEDADLYRKLNHRASFDLKDENNVYFLYDRVEPAGSIDNYFFQDLWAAKHIYKQQPAIQYDIGSSVSSFISSLLSFGQKVCLVDIRPLQINYPNLEFIQCDATTMDVFKDNSIESLSALCSLEHFGLGRYSDPIDPEACFTCFQAISRKMKVGGKLYISVPIGREHLRFNDCRVFYASTIVNSFSSFRLLEFSACGMDYIEENIEDIHKFDDDVASGASRYGLFLFEKM